MPLALEGRLENARAIFRVNVERRLSTTLWRGAPNAVKRSGLRQQFPRPAESPIQATLWPTNSLEKRLLTNMAIRQNAGTSMAPKDWPAQFTKCINAGNVESVVELYDPNARFVATSNELVIGRWRMSQALDHLVRSQIKLDSRVVQEIVFDDTAILYTNFDGTMIDASGARVPIHFKAIEVLRRQEDGNWTLIMSDPSGRTR